LHVLAMSDRNIESETFDIFARAIDHPSRTIRMAGFECLSHMRDHRSKDLISRAFSDPEEGIRNEAPSWERSCRGAHGIRRQSKGRDSGRTP
jgi:hypothetical protein